jgi:hypothetical protein
MVPPATNSSVPRPASNSSSGVVLISSNPRVNKTNDLVDEADDPVVPIPGAALDEDSSSRAHGDLILVSFLAVLLAWLSTMLFGILFPYLNPQSRLQRRFSMQIITFL